MTEPALNMITAVGSVDELRQLASAGSASTAPPKVNSHIHLPPNFSAFDTVQQAIDLATGQHVHVLGVSNYYDYQVYSDFASLAQGRAIFPLFGLETICMQAGLRDAGHRVNDPGNPGKTYFCGKGIVHLTDLPPAAQSLLDTIRKNDSTRMADMTALAAKVLAERGLATGLDHEAVIDMVAQRHNCPRDRVYLQERHICMALQRVLFEKVPADERLARLETLLGAPSKATSPDDEVTIQNELRSHLLKAGKPAFVDEAFLDFDQARELILGMGGIPVYPTLADGVDPICEFEATPKVLIDNLHKLGVVSAEFIPIRNSAAVLSSYVKAMRAAGLVVTAGTEHNTLDLLPIEPTCVGGEPMPEDVKAIFWEGACVVAAHQFLKAQGEAGFVDAQGQPTCEPGVEARDAHIKQFAALGAAVIARYFDQHTPDAGATP